MTIMVTKISKIPHSVRDALTYKDESKRGEGTLSV